MNGHDRHLNMPTDGTLTPAADKVLDEPNDMQRNGDGDEEELLRRRKLFAGVPQWLMAMMPLALSMFAIIWWAQSVERRLALVEKAAETSELADAVFRHEQELITARRDAQLARIEDRMNRHFDEDFVLFQQLREQQQQQRRKGKE